MAPITINPFAEGTDLGDAKRTLDPKYFYAHLSSPWENEFKPQKQENPESLTIVGGGIQGIIAAYMASLKGYQVTLVDGNPDPRTHSAPAQGSTFGGEDSRYITIFEGHPYLRLAGYTDAMYPGMAEAMRTAAIDGGWLSQSPDQFEGLAQRWIDEKYKANDDQEGIRRLFGEYIQENRVSMQLWYEFMRQHPELYDRISLNDQIMRLYDHRELMQTAVASHEKEGVLTRVISAEELARDFPAYAAGVESGFLVGALTMQGMTLRVQEVGKFLLDKIEENGGNLQFSTRIEGISRDNGKVTGVRTASGDAIESRHYAFFTGAYSNPDVYKGSPVYGEVAGIEGYWIEWNNVPKEVIDGMGGMPNKIHGGVLERDGLSRPVVDMNINIVEENGTHTLRIGSGYVGVGHYPFERTPESREETLRDMHLILEKMYGRHYTRAMQEGHVQNSDKVCVRSWSITDRTLNQLEPTKDGGIVSYHGGGNTGSTNDAFVQGLGLIRALEASSKDIVPATRAGVTAELRELGKSPVQDRHERINRAENTYGNDSGMADYVRAVLNQTPSDSKGIQEVKGGKGRG